MNFGPINKILFLGGGRRLSLLLVKIKNLTADILVVTSPRLINNKIDSSLSFKAFLNKNGFPYIVTDRIDSDAVTSEVTDTTLGVSIGAVWVFKRLFIGLFQGRLVNVHGARLPQNRGGGGFSWRILKKDKLGASLVHQVDEGIDTGDIVLYEEYIFPVRCKTPMDYHEYGVQKDLIFLENFIRQVFSLNTFYPTPQQNTFTSYYPRLNTAAHGFIDWNWDVGEIETFVTAFDDPYDGAMTFLNGKK